MPPMHGARRATYGTEQPERLPLWAKGTAVAYVCVVVACAAYFNYGHVGFFTIGGIASAVAVGLVVGRWRAALLALAWPLAAGSLELLFQTSAGRRTGLTRRTSNSWSTRRSQWR